MALCFVSLTVSVAARGLIDTGAKDSDVGGWSFAGASIFLSGSGSGSNDGENDRSVITTRAWLACATVVALVLMLALWSTLLAGDGRRAAAEASVAASTWAKAGDGGFTGTEVGGGGVLGWGDPGLVRIRPSEDMEELVKAVAENEGAPEARTLCRTCIVRKPIRSKVRCRMGGWVHMRGQRFLHVVARFVLRNDILALSLPRYFDVSFISTCIVRKPIRSKVRCRMGGWVHMRGQRFLHVVARFVLR